MLLYQTLISESSLSRRVIPFFSKPYSLISCANKVTRKNPGCVRFLLRLLPENKGYMENILLHTRKEKSRRDFSPMTTIFSPLNINQ